MQYPGYLNGRGSRVPGPTDYARATTRFLRRDAPALRRRHLVVGNVNDATPRLWRRWVGYMSGAAKEWWTKASADGGSGFLTGNDWAYQMSLLREAQARHKIFLAFTCGLRPTTLARWTTRGRASCSSPRGAGARSATRRRAEVSRRRPSGVRTSARRPGPPAQVGGAWRRDFSGGVAVVNPSASATVTLPLGGSYLDPSGSVVTSVLLPPHTGLTLRRAS